MSDKMTHPEKMGALIDELMNIGATVEGRRLEQAFGGMVQFAWGQRAQGTVMKSKTPGVYTMLTIAQDPETKQLRPLQIFFDAEMVMCVIKEPEASPIVQATPDTMKNFLNS